ncbi:MAG: thioredoxin [Bacteroidales bacterium]|nr:thioredoxin [Bacteroidales bacterium]MDD3431515.1 thioredoxin [Bacteroidales bacterium]MDD4361875.1 thioredoxin [Bacteroidales bacterium]MDD4430488.1 thioredoxin [Bacteroidales bacterium]
MALEITDSNFEEYLSSGKALVVDFWAPWCGPCKMIGPIIEELANEYTDRVNIGKMNVDENNDVCVRYGIRNIPTILFFKQGQLVNKQVGAIQKSALAQKVEALL